jgi:hypothetical protein
MNKVLKNAVCIVSVEPVNWEGASRDPWDKDGDGELDYFFHNNEDPEPAESEMGDLKAYAQGQGIWDTDKPGGVVLDQPINTYAELSLYAFKNSTSISIKPSKHVFAEHQYISIGPLMGQNGNAETVYITSISSDKKTLYVQRTDTDPNGLVFDHAITNPNKHAVSIKGVLYGVHEGNFILIGSDTKLKTIAHEYLHTPFAGALSHVKEIDNIMFPIIDIPGGSNKLRYRDIELFDYPSTYESQWKLLSKEEY